MRYYNLDAILAEDRLYNFIIGERSNGKTTAVLRHIISDHMERGKIGVIIRQMEEDIVGRKGGSLFDGCVAKNMISELTDGKYHGVKHKGRGFHLVGLNGDGTEKVEPNPFCLMFSISASVHYKGNSYPNVGTIMFDEFMRTDGKVLQDEVFGFMNLISTVVRDMADARIFMVANTISWNSQYFKVFGIQKIVANMSPGQLLLSERSETRSTGQQMTMTIAIEYCEATAEYGGKDSDVYFLIDDERTRMIFNGSFAIPQYPRCPHEFGARNVKATYWINTGDEILRARLMKVDRSIFVFVDEITPQKYELLKDDRRDVFYDLGFSAVMNHFISPAMSYEDPRTQYFLAAFKSSRLFFQDTTTGENFMYYVRQAENRHIMSL